jgi:hypothetical protein
MRQLQLFTNTELAGMRDRTASRNYSPERDEFRRDHERHRAWGKARQHAERLRRVRDSQRGGQGLNTAEDRRQDRTRQPSPPQVPVPTSGETVECPASSQARPAGQSPPPARRSPGPAAKRQPSFATSMHWPAPTGTRQPEPIAKRQPEPTASRQPKPTASRQPKPTASRQPEPTASRQLGPVGRCPPGPADQRRPRPAGTYRPGSGRNTDPNLHFRSRHHLHHSQEIRPLYGADRTSTGLPTFLRGPPETRRADPNIKAPVNEVRDGRRTGATTVMRSPSPVKEGLRYNTSRRPQLNSAFHAVPRSRRSSGRRQMFGSGQP